MTSGMLRLRAGALAAGALVVALLTAGHTPRGAAAQELPPDDGAPPEEYRLVTGLQPENLGVESPQSLDIVPSPPIDNAFPISGYLRSSCSDSFGDPRGGGRTHLGVDCFAPYGTPLAAVEDGTVRYGIIGEPFSCSTGGDISGNRVSMIGRSGYVYYYGHLSEVWVGAGQPVFKGQLIGRLGNTGNASCSGPHLHFEMKYGENGTPEDPYPWMTGWGRITLPPSNGPSTEGLGAAVWSSPALGLQELYALTPYRALALRTWDSQNAYSPGWYWVGGVGSSDPDVASPRPDYLPYVFVRGTESNIYQIYWTGSGWAGANIGGNCTSGPSAAYPTPTRLEVFCRGWDLALYRRVWEARTGWAASWTRIDSVVTSDPDVIIAGPGQAPEVLVRGSDQAIWLLSPSGSSWRAASLSGVCTSGPSGAYSGPDRLDVFCRGLDMALWYRTWLRGVGWTHWQRIDSVVTSDPEATSMGAGAGPQVFARGLDDQIHQFVWNGSGFTHQVWGMP